MTPRSLGRVAEALDAVSEEDCRSAAQVARNASTAAAARTAAAAVLREARGR
jgi:phosphotransferase system enzyme I (PtsI)